jgi:hypothetical protein
MDLGGMIRWRNALGLEVKNTSPFVHASKCQSEWSSKGLERKRSIPLALCTQELLERSYEKLGADEDYDKALQACARTRLGGARRRNIFR